MGEVISLEKPHPLPIDFQLFKRGHAASDKRLRYIDLTAAILGPDGMARSGIVSFRWPASQQKGLCQVDGHHQAGSTCGFDAFIVI